MRIVHIERDDRYGYALCENTKEEPKYITLQRCGMWDPEAPTCETCILLAFSNPELVRIL